MPFLYQFSTFSVPTYIGTKKVYQFNAYFGPNNVPTLNLVIFLCAKSVPTLDFVIFQYAKNVPILNLDIFQCANNVPTLDFVIIITIIATNTKLRQFSMCQKCTYIGLSHFPVCQKCTYIGLCHFHYHNCYQHKT